MSLRRTLFSFLGLSLFTLSLSQACGEKKVVGNLGTGGRTGSDGGADGLGGLAGSLIQPTNNCGNQACEGEGATCVETNGVSSCECIPGYLKTAKDDGYVCEVDKSCVKLRFLENGCRVQQNGAPAVGLFFGADYCSGTAVLPEDIGSLTGAFTIEEDGKPLTVEADATIVSRDVESFVGIVLDVSRSVQDKPELLSQLTTELSTFVEELQPAVGKPPVTISLMVFAQDFGTLVPFTTNAVTLKAKLAELEASPSETILPALINYAGIAQIDGTSLWKAVEKGIQQVERMQRTRTLVTDNGVLTSGTLVVITDGEDTNNQTGAPNLAGTLVNVISLGVSDEIKGATLAAVGRDGAFLASSPAARELAFDRIASRVKHHPDRAYLLGYCSAASIGSHNVSITLTDADIETTPASCTFDAGIFGGAACDASLFTTRCDDLECGTMYACGACSNGNCCSGGLCEPPSPTTDCRGLDELCADGQSCVPVTPATDPVSYECVTAIPEGDSCEGTTADCVSGTFCDILGTKKCTLADLSPGDSCMGDNNTLLDGRRCIGTANCQRFNSTTAFCDYDPARMFDACGTTSGSAVCPKGTYCDGICQPKLPQGLYSCASDIQCGSGLCSPTSHLCSYTGQCNVSWDDMLGN